MVCLMLLCNPLGMQQFPLVEASIFVSPFCFCLIYDLCITKRQQQKQQKQYGELFFKFAFKQVAISVM